MKNSRYLVQWLWKASLTLGAALCLLVTTKVQANVSLAVPFSDHLVLQRDMPVPVWGTAAAGEPVTVEFGGQTKSTTADGAGKWLVKLDPMPASAEPRVLTVRGKNTLTLTDVLVGEVWLCSGQSNMEVSLERLKISLVSSEAAKVAALERLDRELASTTPGIRLFHFGLGKGEALKTVWTQCDPDALKNHTNGPHGFSATGYFFGKKLQEELKVPVGLIQASVGGTTIETWTPPRGKNFLLMVQHLPPLALRGVIWYQGESDLMACDEGAKYAEKMEALIQDWRKLWDQPELPFYYVQLPPFGYSKRRGSMLLTTEALPQFREGQALALRLAHTGMIITTDLAPVHDLHPIDKWDVGQRLAWLALAQTYGRKDLVHSGPVYKSSEQKGNQLVLTFDHINGGLVSKDGKPLTDFKLAGNDQQFFPAKVVIEGDRVVVSCDRVSQPVAVRFAWQEDSRPNLFNKAGLPAAPFRTDNWLVQIAVPNPHPPTPRKAAEQ